MYKNINILSDSTGQSTEPSETFREQDKPEHSLQDLVEAEAGPQSQVGPEEVQAVHEAELVHRGLLHSDIRVKVETQQSCGVFSCRHLPLHCGGGSQTRQQTRRLQNAIEQVH